VQDAKFVMALCKQYGWQNIAVLNTNDPFGSKGSEEIVKAAQGANVNVRAQASFDQNCGILATPCDIQPQLGVIKSSLATVVVMVMLQNGELQCCL
jgi:hypothetical protein